MPCSQQLGGAMKVTWLSGAGQLSQTSLSCWTAQPLQITWCTCAGSPGQTENQREKIQQLSVQSDNLELVGHHVQAEVPASANIPLKVKSLFPSLVGLWNILIEMIFNGVSWKLGRDRAATWVEEPVGLLPADQVALRELFAPRHLEVGIERERFGLRFHLKQLLVRENLVPHLKVGHLAMCWHHWGGSGLVDAP